MPFLSALANDFGEMETQLVQTVERVRDGVEHITDIVRTQQGFDKDMTVLKDLDLEETIKAAVQILQDSVHKRGIQLHVDCAGAPAQVPIRESSCRICIDGSGSAWDGRDESVEYTLTTCPLFPGPPQPVHIEVQGGHAVGPKPSYPKPRVDEIVVGFHECMCLLTTAFRTAVHRDEIYGRQKIFRAFENLGLRPFSFHLENDGAGTVDKFDHRVKTHCVDGKAYFGTSRIDDRAVRGFGFREEIEGRVAIPEGLANRPCFALIHIQIDAASLESFRLERDIVHSLGARPKPQFTHVGAAVDEQSPGPCPNLIEMVLLHQPLDPCPYSTLVAAMSSTAAKIQFVRAIPRPENAVSLAGLNPVGSTADAIARVDDPAIETQRSPRTEVRYQPPEHLRPQCTIQPFEFSSLEVTDAGPGSCARESEPGP